MKANCLNLLVILSIINICILTYTLYRVSGLSLFYVENRIVELEKKVERIEIKLIEVCNDFTSCNMKSHGMDDYIIKELSKLRELIERGR